VNKTVASTVTVLDNTTPNQNFSESALITQRDAYLGILNSVVGTQTRVQASINNLEGLGLNDEKLANSLKTAVDSAESQLEMAKVAYENALVNLERAKQAKEQQILSAQMSIDNSLGQLNLNRDQFSDLTLKAPISGRITKKAVDLGTEASPGQLIAQVSQTDELKIEINLSSEDAYAISEGQLVIINNKYEAEISSINPAADEITRKVKAEIRFDNQDNKLIPGTTVDIEIPASSEELDDVSAESIFIPIRAVNIDQIENYVFIADADQAKKVIVEIGDQKGNLIEIVSGLKAGDMLIVDGGRILEDGDLIDIK
jgi:RND family efflux transporter MFP subunit